MDRKKWIAGGALVLAVVGGGTTLAIASSGDGDEPLTGSALEQATAAALAHTDGGSVIESETGDDGAAFGVEIRLDDGSVVEVALDENFKVIGSRGDEDGTGADDETANGDSEQDD